jgi:hypothetical protein
MGLQIDLPSAGLLGVSGATGGVISSDTNAVQNGIYILQFPGVVDLTLPATMDAGGTVLVKNLGSGTLRVVSSTSIDGFSGVPVVVSQGQSARFVYVSASFGYLKA